MRLRKIKFRLPSIYWSKPDLINESIAMEPKTVDYVQLLKLLEVPKIKLIHYVAKKLNNTVYKGPFKGMKIEIGDLLISNKLLGIYEECLHPWIELGISSAPDCILNVGSGDGYYAIGLGLRCPQAPVFCIDTNHNCFKMLGENAIVNGFTNYKCYTESTPECIETLLKNFHCPLVFMDCEGAEKELLDLSSVPSLSRSFIIVELHPFLVSGIDSLILSRFSETHTIHRIQQTTPCVHIPELYELCDWDKMILLSESRPCTMEWFCCIPKNNK